MSSIKVFDKSEQKAEGNNDVVLRRNVESWRCKKADIRFKPFSGGRLAMPSTHRSGPFLSETSPSFLSLPLFFTWPISWHLSHYAGQYSMAGRLH